MSDSEAAKLIVDSLLQEGSLTPDQARRVLAAVQSGKDLVWSLSHLPMIEPLQLRKAQSRLPPSSAGAGGFPAMPGTPRPGGAGNSSSGGNPITGEWSAWRPEPVQKEFSAQANPVPELDLDEPSASPGKFEGVGLPAKTPPPGFAEATPNFLPDANTPPVFPLGKIRTDSGTSKIDGQPPPVLPMGRLRTDIGFSKTEGSPPPVSPMGKPRTDTGVPKPEDFIRPGMPIPSYDLADDEGIPLIKRVNAMLVEALDAGVRQMFVRYGSKGITVSFISEVGTSGRYMQMDMAEGERVCNRMKIMARIEPWRKPPQKGIFLVRHHKRVMRALLEINSSMEYPEREDLIVHFLAGA